MLHNILKLSCKSSAVKAEHIITVNGPAECVCVQCERNVNVVPYLGKEVCPLMDRADPTQVSWTL